ncbi:helix-turn-helix domain-containing protein [Janthinobacterium aestuarii]
MKLKPWAKMPTDWIKADKLSKFNWKTNGSAGTAALMIYFTMCQFAAERPLRPTEKAEEEDVLPAQPAHLDPIQAQLRPDMPLGNSGVKGMVNPAPVYVMPNNDFLKVIFPLAPAAEAVGISVNDEGGTEEHLPTYLISRLTYDDIASMTGLSRDRISAGLQKLIQEKLIWRVDQSSSYGLSGFGQGKRWAKLPGKVLISSGATRFEPFTHFMLRSKHELNALKLHFYYAYARSDKNAYCEVSYPTIHLRTGIPTADIARANSLLLSCGILQRTRGLPSDDKKQHESNKYYLAGFEGFFIVKKAA